MIDASLHFVNDLAGVEEFMRWLGERRPLLAFDTETQGLKFTHDDVRLLQIGDAQSGWAFPWHLWGGVGIDALHRYEGPLVGHNVPFDVTFIEERGGVKLPWTRMNDTMVMTHLLDSRYSKALKSTSARILGSYAEDVQLQLQDAMHQNKWTWATVPIDFPWYWGYACVDTVLTARCAEIMLPQVLNSGLRPVYELEMEVGEILMGMYRRGARVDLDYCYRARDDLSARILELREQAQREYGIENVNSNQQVVAKLLEANVPLLKRTKGGDYSLDKEVLEGLMNTGIPLGVLVAEVRGMTKILGTYFENLIEMAMPRGDHVHTVHASINQLGARTGRMSMELLQTLPRGTIVRDAFIPRPGNKLVAVDSDQIEMRLLAHFCRDPDLIAAIMSGDLHTTIARRIYADPTLDKKDPRRQTGKNSSFSKVYGAGVVKFAITAGISVQEAQAVYDSYDSLYPGVPAFINEVQRVGKLRAAEEGDAYVRTPLGRKQIADDARVAYTLVNYLIQGTAADVLKQQLVSLSRSGLDEYMLLPVHDEVIFDFPEDECADLTDVAVKAMTVHDFAVPITVEASGPLDRWGSKYR